MDTYLLTYNPTQLILYTMSAQGFFISLIEKDLIPLPLINSHMELQNWETLKM